MPYLRKVTNISKPDYSKSMNFVAIGIFEDKGPQGHNEIDSALGGLVTKVWDRKEFKGKKGDSLVLHGTDNLERVALVGLGEYEKFTGDIGRQAAGTAAGLAFKHKAAECALVAFKSAIPEEELVQALAEGLILGSYKFTEYKKPEDDTVELKSASILGVVDKGGLERGNAVGNAVCLARDLQNHPANVMTPGRLAEEAKKIAKAGGMTLKVFERDEFTKLGMLALAGVAQGSNEPAKFIVMEYKGGNAGDAPFALVGKGLTFDSGGISLKPGAAMDEMKFDMSGSATVLGVMQAIAVLKPSINVVAAIPSTENMPGGKAQRPGDIVKAYNGKTIEILNTDAEGRLILADALAYVVDKYKPAAMLDFATLTGAVLIALGHKASGLMGNNDELIEEVKSASEKTGERVWQLPMWEEYTEDIKSKIADIKNLGEARLAGTVAGGVFLKEFVGDTPWAHLDIAGTAWQGKDQPYVPAGGSGVAVRLVTSLILDRA
ncbi:leucyl aminopeptidase [Candidatus Neomarinimicrobiota bacterium]